MILAPRYPFPENGGDVLRINNIARYFRRKGYEVTLLSFYTGSKKKLYKDTEAIYSEIVLVRLYKLESFIYSTIALVLRFPIQLGYYFSFRYLVKFIIKKRELGPDIIIPHLIRMVPYLYLTNTTTNVIVEMTDVLSKTYSFVKDNNLLSLKRLIYQIEKKPVKRMELSVVDKFNKVCLVSYDDVKYLGEKKSLVIYSNGVNCIDSNIVSKPNKIVFVGNMRTLQNQDAAVFFLNEIWPQLKDIKKGLELHFVGAEPPDFLLRLANNKDIFVTGYIDDIGSYISDSTISVVPIRIAAGIQNKVLISMAYGVPCVMTSLVSKGIPEMENLVNCRIADNPKDFCLACISLLENITERQKYSERSKKIIREKYSWDYCLNGYETLRFRSRET